jgi:hypothetical protein
VEAAAAASAILVATLSYLFAKWKEREADWRKYKFEIYREFVTSMSGTVGTDSTPEGNRAFAKSCNTLHLIGSRGALAALHAYQNEIRVSNPDKSDERHDELLLRLVWEIRKDLRIPRTPCAKDFDTRLWCSGANGRDKANRR